MTTTREKSKKAKKNHGEEEEVVEKDRLSDLPDGILLHILSFLPEIRFCVRTTLLSKRWNNLWASLADLIFDIRESRYAQSFKELVRNVLNRRENLPVNKLSFKYYENQEDESLITSIIKYAMSHNVQHFSLLLYSASFTCLIPVFNISSSLKTLNLKSFSNANLLEDFTLPTLTTLNLSYCRFGDNGEGEPVSNSIDPFVGLFNLKSLRLHGCSVYSVRRNFKISGPQLASLNISGLYHYNGKVEIFAPKLRFFSCKWVLEVNFSDLDFPHLEMADIDDGLPSVNAKEALLGLINMFRGLYNAHSLVLPSHIIKGLMEYPEVLEDQSSPFVRLTTLKVKCPARLMSSFTIPDNVMKYFAENVTVEKIKH